MNDNMEELQSQLSGVAKTLSFGRTAAPCPTDEELTAFIAHVRKMRTDDAVAHHLVRCDTCFRVVADALNALALAAKRKPLLEISMRLLAGGAVLQLRRLELGVVRETVAEYGVDAGAAQAVVGDLRVMVKSRLSAQAREVTVRVSDHQTNTPRWGAVVRVLSTDQGVLAEQMTNRDGVAQFPGLSLGEYLLQIEAAEGNLTS